MHEFKNNNQYYKKLEIDVVIKQAADFAITPKVRDDLLELEPSNDIVYIEAELTAVEEASFIARRYERAPISIASDFDRILQRASIGGVLTSLEIYDVVKQNSTISANIRLLQMLLKDKVNLHYYNELVNSFVPIEQLAKSISKAIDYDGVILDSASPRLTQIRSKLKGIDSHIKQKMNEILAKESSKLTESLIVMRDDCYCLPVRAEYKNSIKGIVHDTSTSMQTFYIEPLAVSELTSQKIKLRNEEVEEIHVILKNFSNQISNDYESLSTNFQIIKRLDFIFAKALLANQMDAIKPRLVNNRNLNLIQARHPLLNVPKVIPNDVSFNDKYFGIIITGPNTGGKTVLLKTVGLLALMVKFGFLIPCQEGSIMNIFDNIYCDIGDDQSIASNLSTFSSHLSKIVAILNNVTSNSLVLFDEIGAGTDPLEGSSLAIAILKHLLTQKVSFITTTHYSELKTFGFNESKVINASMEFDENSLSPTYRLILGVSGSSNAFNIASRMGLKADIISDAKELLAKSSDDTRMIVEKIEEKNLELVRLQHDLQQQLLENSKLQAMLDSQLKGLEKEKQQIIKKAQLEAQEIILSTRQEATKLLEEINVLKQTTPKIHEVAEAKHKLNQLDFTRPERHVDKNHVYQVGEDVYVPSYDQYGIIEKIAKNKLDIAVGNIHLRLAIDEVEPVSTNEAKKIYTAKVGTTAPIKSTKSIQMRLDLRGMRYDEARDALVQYMDDLLLTGLKQAVIIHGFGTGAIRKLVQDYLKNNHLVKEYRYGGEGEGGQGVTVVTLK